MHANLILSAVTVAALLGLPTMQESHAQSAADFPVRPIRFIVPSVAGAGADITARLIAAHMSQSFGQQVIVDNRSGASGLIAFDALTKAVPDGYTLVLMSVNHPVSKYTIRGFQHDRVKDIGLVIQ